MAIIAVGGGGTDLYCHSGPPLTSGKLCFIINFTGGQRGQKFLLGGSLPLPFEPPLDNSMVAPNLFRKLCTKFYQNRTSFVKDITINILVSFFRTDVYIV